MPNTRKQHSRSTAVTCKSLYPGSKNCAHNRESAKRVLCSYASAASSQSLSTAAPPQRSPASIRRLAKQRTGRLSFAFSETVVVARRCCCISQAISRCRSDFVGDIVQGGVKPAKSKLKVRINRDEVVLIKDFSAPKVFDSLFCLGCVRT